MVEHSVDNSISLPDWLIRFCKWFWSVRALVWGIIITNILVAVVITWAFTAPSALLTLPIGPLFSQPFAMLVILVVLASLTVISGLIGRLSVLPPIREVQRQYFNHMILEYQKLVVVGAPSINTDEIFISVDLWPNRAIAEQPLSASELKALRERVGNEVTYRSVVDVINKAETNWAQPHSDNRIDIKELWKRLTSKEPVAVIQGFPGMGKSTLLRRLALHMARRCLDRGDSIKIEGQRHTLPFIPILIHLGIYADSDSSTIDEYLSKDLQSYNVPGLNEYVIQSLSNGSCLVMFDALDEVSDQKKRGEVQIAINNFIRRYQSMNTNEKRFNKYLITSRIPGYDYSPFASYAHYTIAPLTKKQINFFIKKCYIAYMKHEYNSVDNDILSAEVDR